MVWYGIVSTGLGARDGYWYTCHAPVLVKKKKVKKKEKGGLDRWEMRCWGAPAEWWCGWAVSIIREVRVEKGSGRRCEGVVC